MRKISPDSTFIDYFQDFSSIQRGLTNRVGIRVEESHCMAVVTIGDGQPFVFGKEYPLPAGLKTLPGHLQIMIDDYVLHYPGSELTEILAGRISFQEALNSPPEMEPAARIVLGEGSERAASAQR